jgi:CheY-like chemotaxis protein
LLNNAAKYTPNGGQITVRAERRGANVVVSVRDNGAGIRPEVLASVFDPFVQGERSYSRAQGGLGIGLTLARSIVLLHGGNIEARSAGVGQGSEFIVRLPAPQSAAASASEAPARPQTRIAGQRILVVDDNVDAAESLAALLRTRGQVVSVVHNGQDALAQALEQRPDVVLLDIGLPGMNGYEVASALRRQTGGGPALVAITGYGQDADARRAAEAGFDRHLVKPVDAGELEQVLAAVTR